MSGSPTTPILTSAILLVLMASYATNYTRPHIPFMTGTCVRPPRSRNFLPREHAHSRRHAKGKHFPCLYPLPPAPSSHTPTHPDLDPQETVAVRKKQSMWHSEMYGYVFAAAEVGVTHRVRVCRRGSNPTLASGGFCILGSCRLICYTYVVLVRQRDVMLYPGYEPFMGRGPAILHCEWSGMRIQDARRVIITVERSPTRYRRISWIQQGLDLTCCSGSLSLQPDLIVLWIPVAPLGSQSSQTDQITR